VLNINYNNQSLNHENTIATFRNVGILK
jgi:hypothetical protein